MLANTWIVSGYPNPGTLSDHSDVMPSKPALFPQALVSTTSPLPPLVFASYVGQITFSPSCLLPHRPSHLPLFSPGLWAVSNWFTNGDPGSSLHLS